MTAHSLRVRVRLLMRRPSSPEKPDCARSQGCLSAFPFGTSTRSRHGRASTSAFRQRDPQQHSRPPAWCRLVLAHVHVVACQATNPLPDAGHSRGTSRSLHCRIESGPRTSSRFRRSIPDPGSKRPGPGSKRPGPDNNCSINGYRTLRLLSLLRPQPLRLGHSILLRRLLADRLFGGRRQHSQA